MLECPRVRYEHDYWNLADPSHKQYQKEMWEGSLRMVFLSPAHYYEYRRVYPDIEFESVMYQPSPIEQDKFHPTTKKNICIYIGSLEMHKGILDVLMWGKDKGVPICVYGTGKHAKTALESPIAIYEGKATYKEVQKAMAEADMFIHLPVWVEPFGRVVMEARFAGCRIITNNRLGAKSYDWWDKDTDELRPFLEEQGRVFWKSLGLA